MSDFVNFQVPNFAANLQQMMMMKQQGEAARANAAVQLQRFQMDAEKFQMDRDRFMRDKEQFERDRDNEVRKANIEMHDYALKLLASVESEEELEMAKEQFRNRFPPASGIVDQMIPEYNPRAIEMIRDSLRTESERLKLERQQAEGEKLQGFAPGTDIYKGAEKIASVPFRDDPDFVLFEDAQGNQAYLQKGAKIPKGWTKYEKGSGKGTFDLFEDAQGNQVYVEEGNKIPSGLKKVGTEKLQGFSAGTDIYKGGEKIASVPTRDTTKVEGYDLFQNPEGNQVYIQRGDDIPEGWAKVGGSGGVTINMPRAAPASERESLNKLFEFNSQLDRIAELYNPEFVGRVQGPMGVVKEVTGAGANVAESEFRQIVNDISDTLLRLRSGAQINEQEYQRLRKLVPTLNLPEAVFQARLRSLKTAIENSIRTRRGTMEQSGFITPSAEGIDTIIRFDQEGNRVE